MEEKRAILRTKNLKAYYSFKAFGIDRNIRALDDVTFDIYEKEIFGIAGESGCGKSTLMKVLYGLIKSPLRHVGGDAIYKINGKEKSVFSFDKEKLRRLRWSFMSYIPQGSMNILNPTLRIKKQFLNIIKAHKDVVNVDEAENIAVEHIKSLGLPLEVLRSYPHQLSGGMRQRVTIALATVLKPRIIFGDEPTTALDVVVQRGVIQLLKDIQKELDNTVIMVTHDMAVHAELTDRIGIMYAGKMVEIASTHEIFKEPLHPYTQYLINSLPRIGDKSEKVSVPGAPPSLANPPSGCRFHPRCPYAKQICKEKEPPLEELKPGHFVACFIATERGVKNG